MIDDMCRGQHLSIGMKDRLPGFSGEPWERSSCRGIPDAHPFPIPLSTGITTHQQVPIGTEGKPLDSSSSWMLFHFLYQSSIGNPPQPDSFILKIPTGNESSIRTEGNTLVCAIIIACHVEGMEQSTIGNLPQ